MSRYFFTLEYRFNPFKTKLTNIFYGYFKGFLKKFKNLKLSEFCLYKTKDFKVLHKGFHEHEQKIERYFFKNKIKKIKDF